MEPNDKLISAVIWTGMVFLIALAFFMTTPVQAEELHCVNAEEQLCEDLLGLEVEVKRTSERMMSYYCGIGAEACAKLDTRTGVCTIYFIKKKKMPDYVLNHETNHCRGWTHKTNKHRHYHGDWGVIPNVLEYLATRRSQ